ncbi:SHOCT domain-containing protein [Pseudonocardia abyssalis]|jgi:putative membrane protein|uniref:SHOCT domain-containing protein n=1 Tax=Pseudonocardia abyssalis TaxID=2792008 RepID=A0ABS6URM5_9PSEU|nr:SHOCT domain-containing protein [Pseudonocardia abyssalis]MBW0114311.1 SHOCT domain-containing protein [Pseudonocardia abyssalis]MBW0134905.1 SHOCT domain-containing protein [Pseudonocardia abyssalis]
MMDGSMGWLWIWPVFVVVGLVLLGYVAYGLVQRRGTRPGAWRLPALRTLDERYARGEIDDHTYRTRRAELT